MNFDVRNIARSSVLELSAYSSARDEFQGDARIFLDANENALGSPLEDDFSRYPDPFQGELCRRLSILNGIEAENIFIGNGSDEIIDLLIRIFCEPNEDEIIVCPPTYGMYQVSAATSAVRVNEIPLDGDFNLRTKAILEGASQRSKLLFLCSPNNPTGKLIDDDQISELAQNFEGIVVVDEAYIEFSGTNGFLPRISEHPNVIITRTLSKAWGLAGLRIGIGFASTELLGLLRKIKPPYNVSDAAQRLAAEAVDNFGTYEQNLNALIRERGILVERLRILSFVEKVFDSDANFVLVRFQDSSSVFEELLGEGVVVRDRSGLPGCENCLRITIGTEEENNTLIEILENLQI